MALRIVHLARADSTNIAGPHSQFKCSTPRPSLIFSYRVSNQLQDEALEDIEPGVQRLSAARQAAISRLPCTICTKSTIVAFAFSISMVSGHFVSSGSKNWVHQRCSRAVRVLEV